MSAGNEVVVLDEATAAELLVDLRRYFERRGFSWCDAEDAAQEVLRRLLKRRCEASCSADTRHHAFALASQRFRELRRATARRRWISLEGIDVADSTPNRGSAIDELVQELRLREALSRSRLQLKATEREFLVFVTHYGYTTMEAGAALGWTQSVAWHVREGILKKMGTFVVAQSSSW